MQGVASGHTQAFEKVGRRQRLAPRLELVTAHKSLVIVKEDDHGACSFFHTFLFEICILCD